MSSPPDSSEDLENTREGAVAVQRDNLGTINTGLQINIQQLRPHEPSARAQELRNAYLRSLCSTVNQLPLFAAETGSTQVQLSCVYTALLTSRTEHATPSRSDHTERMRHLSALDALNAEARLVLLGGPGSGKSTFLCFVALALAGEILGISPNVATLSARLPHENTKSAKPQRWDHGALLPVRVVLRDFAAQLPPPGARIGANTLWEFICGQLQQLSLGDFAAHLQDELLERGGLVLLDGLDEVPEADRRREQVKQAVQSFAATYHRCRFTVTSRTYAYQRQDWKLDGFSEAQLLPFATGQIRAFVDAWYAHMQELHRLTAPEAEARALRLKELSSQNERIRDLAEWPLLLTLIAKLQTERGGELPQKREELYDRAVEMLLSQWEEMKPRGHDAAGKPRYEQSLSEFLQTGRDAIRVQLNQLAFDAHREQQELRGSAAISKSQVIGALLDANPQRRAEVRVGLLEEFLRDRSGLLVAHGVDLYQFPHRSFQEYLAACHLTDAEFPEDLARLLRADPNRWREVTLLAGAKAARGSANNVWLLVEELCPGTAHAEVGLQEQWGALLAGQLLVQSADLQRIANRNLGKLERVRHWQAWLLQHSALPALERALAGRTLAILGDPRPEIMQLDHMQFCFVPAGAFVMGSRNRNEHPPHTVDLPYDYFIARFPVSVAQWRDYLQQSARSVETARKSPGRDNEPVVGVSWHDAREFCNALTTRWCNHLPAGWSVALPSEAEWEKAARGGERIPADPRVSDLLAIQHTLATPLQLIANREPRRAYPWGKTFEPEFANVGNRILEPSALGCFAAGRSPYACEELSGNICEWTRSLWGAKWGQPHPDFKYPYDSTQQTSEAMGATDEIMRVLRGGAFDLSAQSARCSFRYRLVPASRDDNLGFRVALRAPTAYRHGEHLELPMV